MSWLRSIAWGAALVAGAAACGYPHITYDTSTTASNGGGGGTGTTTSTSAGTGTGGSVPVCEPLGSACGANAKCTANVNTGARECIALDATTASAWSACTLDRECPVGHFCDPHNNVCKPICNGSCAPCVPVRDRNGNTIDGLSVCVAACEPELSLQCGMGATCAWDPTLGGGNGAFDCFQDGTKNYGDTCSAGLPPSCVSGYVCALGQCRDWCVTSPDDCVTGYCADFDSFTPKQGGDTYGFCL
jgi:hypothetical protein